MNARLTKQRYTLFFIIIIIFFDNVLIPHIFCQQLCKQEDSEGLCPHIKSSGQCFFLHRVHNVIFPAWAYAQITHLHLIFQRDLVELIRQAVCKLGLDIIPDECLLPSDEVTCYCNCWKNTIKCLPLWCIPSQIGSEATLRKMVKELLRIIESINPHRVQQNKYTRNFLQSLRDNEPGCCFEFSISNALLYFHTSSFVKLLKLQNAKVNRSNGISTSTNLCIMTISWTQCECVSSNAGWMVLSTNSACQWPCLHATISSLRTPKLRHQYCESQDLIWNV